MDTGIKMIENSTGVKVLQIRVPRFNSGRGLQANH